MKHSIPYYLSYATVLLFVAVVILVSYWLIYPYKTFTFPKEPLTVITKTVKPGDVLVFFSESCRYREGAVKVNRSLHNQTLINFPEHNFVNDRLGCVEFQNATVVIPDYAPSGEYHLEISSCMQVNPIREVCTKVITESFNVI